MGQVVLSAVLSLEAVPATRGACVRRSVGREHAHCNGHEGALQTTDPIVGNARRDALHRVGAGQGRREAHRGPGSVARETDRDFARSLSGVGRRVVVRVVTRNVFGRVADVLPGRDREGQAAASEQVVEEVVAGRDAALDDRGFLHS